MKVTNDISLENFDFWGGARDLADMLTHNELETIEEMLTEGDPDYTIDSSELNDFFWFEGDTIAEWLGYENEEDLMMRNSPRHLLKKAEELVWKACADNLYSDIDIDSIEVEEFRKNHGDMSVHDFLETGWKEYIAEDNGVELPDADKFIDHDTEEYIQIMKAMEGVAEKVAEIEEGRSDTSWKNMEEAWNRAQEALGMCVDIATDSQAIDKLLEDMEKCDNFLDQEKDSIEADR